MILFACIFFFYLLIFSGRQLRNIVDRFKKLSLNISNTCCFFCTEQTRKLFKSINVHCLISISPINVMFLSFVSDLTFKIIHNQVLLIGFVLRISAQDHVITHKNKKNILRKANERAIQMKGTLTIALFIILTTTPPPPCLRFLDTAVAHPFC